MSKNSEIFAYNLEAARRKAGSVSNLMNSLDGTSMTYYGWKKKAPKRIDTKLVVNLANYLETTAEKLFTEKVSMPQDLNEGSGGLSLSKFLEIQEELKRLRKKHTWSVMNYWFEKFDELLTEADDDIDGLRNLIQILKPPMKEKDDGSGLRESNTEEANEPE